MKQDRAGPSRGRGRVTPTPSRRTPNEADATTGSSRPGPATNMLSLRWRAHAAPLRDKAQTFASNQRQAQALPLPVTIIVSQHALRRLPQTSSDPHLTDTETNLDQRLSTLRGLDSPPVTCDRPSTRKDLVDGGRNFGRPDRQR